MERANTTIPWIEKYRPSNFDDIVLDDINKQMFKNILSQNYFPNLLFYGPPGTGKTTTIINIIKAFQNNNNDDANGSIIHLNASDERGIDVIRNHIQQFVKSKNIFKSGLKFVILDEVDYMTKNAQNALKYLIQSYTTNVRFCLVCNYISKIDYSLQNEFICARFNQLPKNEIYKLIQTIVTKERLCLKENTIHTIMHNYNSDIRSMINYIQLNQNIIEWNDNIITDIIWKKMNEILIDTQTEEKIVIFKEYIHDVSIKYNTDKKCILKDYFNYLIRIHPENITDDFLNIVEITMHSKEYHINNVVDYIVRHIKLKKRMSKTK
jgi:replication factor C subunit 3/5|tara:strand:+ start:74 stop:1042 length:969 start_codon:yes stop_codon:yes gene_type:complete